MRIPFFLKLLIPIVLFMGLMASPVFYAFYGCTSLEEDSLVANCQ